MYYYRKHNDGSVMDWSTVKFSEDCFETTKEIVQAWNGSYYLEDELPAMPADVAAAKALEEAKEERAEEVSSIKVTVDGMTFDGDEVAQQQDHCHADDVILYQRKDLPRQRHDRFQITPDSRLSGF